MRERPLLQTRLRKVRDASACIVRGQHVKLNDAVVDKEGCSALASGSLLRDIARLSQQDEDRS